MMNDWAAETLLNRIKRITNAHAVLNGCPPPCKDIKHTIEDELAIIEAENKINERFYKGEQGRNYE